MLQCTLKRKQKRGKYSLVYTQFFFVIVCVFLYFVITYFEKYIKISFNEIIKWILIYFLLIKA